jgi:hypothetical protein
MAIQNIDFAKKIEREVDIHKRKDNKQNNKVSWYMIIFFVGFSIGFYVGFQFFKLKHIEENLIKNPDKLQDTYNEGSQDSQLDKNNEEEKIYANVSEEKGNIIILIGKFNAKRSSEIIKYLKLKEVLNRFPFYSCEGIDNFQAFQNTGGIYRIPIENGKYHKIILGCFLNHDNALKVLNELKSINENLFKNSTILQIESNSHQ